MAKNTRDADFAPKITVPVGGFCANQMRAQGIRGAAFRLQQPYHDNVEQVCPFPHPNAHVMHAHMHTAPICAGPQRS